MQDEQPQQPTNDPERAASTPPAIWVGLLSDYNAGLLHGAWIDPARELDEVQADVHTMLACSPTARATSQVAEEYGIFDFEGFGPLRIGEYDSLAHVTEVARGIAQNGAGFAAWASVADAEELAEFSDRLLAHVPRIEDYVDELVDELGYRERLDAAVPDSFRPYVHIDVAGLARDMQLCGDIIAVSDASGGYWLFRSA